jgi:rare lipoprotein A (peptidoglycan hydrolase)
MNIRRKIKRFERRHNLDLKHDLFVALLGMVAAIIFFLAGNVILAQVSKPIVIEVKTVQAETIIVSPTAIPTETPQPTRIPTKAPVKAGTVINSGKASYYSIDGCLGCNPGRIMANGEKLDDTRLTLAYNHLPMNTVVTVRNTETGASVRATVTDTGGFERHGKIADLSVATRDALGCGSTCPIVIEL